MLCRRAVIATAVAFKRHEGVNAFSLVWNEQEQQRTRKRALAQFMSIRQVSLRRPRCYCSAGAAATAAAAAAQRQFSN